MRSKTTDPSREQRQLMIHSVQKLGSAEGIKINVPFIPQEVDTDCALACLKMVSSYYRFPIEESYLSEILQSEQTGFTWTIGIALAAAKLGLTVSFYSKVITPTDEIFDRELTNGSLISTDSAANNVQRILKTCEALGVKICEATISLESFLEHVREDSLVIPLINSNIIYGRPGYQGHFVVMTGYNEHDVIVHEPGKLKPEAFKAIPKTLFNRARCSPGTDEDFVVLRSK